MASNDSPQRPVASIAPARPAVVSVGLGAAMQADRAAPLGGLSYAMHGMTAAMAPSRLLVGACLAILLMAAGWSFDKAYLALGGRPGVAQGVVSRSENPLAEAERNARMTAASFVGGTAFASGVTTETTMAELAVTIDGAGRERLASIADKPERRRTILLDWDRARGAIERARPHGPAEMLSDGWGDAVRHLVASVLGLSLTDLGAASMEVVVHVPAAAFRLSVWGTSAWLLIAILLCSMGGGMLARMSAVEAARGEKIPAAAALAWLGGSWRRLLGVPLAPLAIVLGLLAVVLVNGALLRVPGLDLAGGLLYGLSIGCMTLAVLVAALGLLGLPLSIAAVACGDADALDAGVRSAAYIGRSPLRTLGLAAASIAGVGVGTLVVGTVVAIAMGLTAWGVGVLGGDGAATAGGASSLLGEGGQGFGVIAGRLGGVTERPAAAVIDLWEAIVGTVAVGYVLSAVVETFTRSYVVLRLVCDGEDCSALDGHPLGRPAVTPPASA